MNRNFMVKKVTTDSELINVITTLNERRICGYAECDENDDLVIKVNVGGTKKRKTKRFEICKELGFRFIEVGG